MSITYPPEMLPGPDEGEEAEVVVICPRCQVRAVDRVLLGAEGHICGVCWANDRAADEYSSLTPEKKS